MNRYKGFEFLLGIIGFLIFIFSIGSFAYEINFLAHGVRASGVVDQMIIGKSSKGRTTYSPEIVFQAADKQTYKFVHRGLRLKPVNVATVVDVIYDGNNPQSAQIDDIFALWFVPILSLVLGSMLVLSSYMLLKLDFFNPRRKEYLQRSGRLLQTQLISVQDALTSKGRGAIAWRIESRFEEGNKKYRFYSQMLDFNPQPIIEKYSVSTIPVWVDNRNMGKYYVDIEKLVQASKEASPLPQT